MTYGTAHKTDVPVAPGSPLVSIPPATTPYPEEPISRAAVGWTLFAGVMMIVAGGIAVLQGLAWLINPERFPGQDLVISQNVETWGWTQLVLGAIVLLAGFGVFVGNVLARTIGVLAAILSVFAAFVALPFYPFWGVCVIAIDIAVIWALTVHGRDMRTLRELGS
jgi:magnesium-transporting ATPase (P-type)